LGTVVIHQPQIASWDDQKKMVAWSAVAYTPKGASSATMGTIKIEAKTKVSTQERLVSFKDFQITDSAFSTMKPEDSKTIVKAIESSIPDDERVIGLDRVMASIDVSAIKPRNTPGVKSDPPKIFVSSTPAILVNIDGDVVWSPIKDNELKYLVNTNWDVFEHTAYKTYYLRVEQSWLKATALEGPWTPATDLPAAFKQLPANDNWADVMKNLPGKPFAAGRPKVFVSTAPAEMILTTGAPVYQSVKGTKLQWVSNTDSDIFRNGKDGDFYYVITGRWFKAPSLDGPWTFASLELPEDFKDIPLEHPRSRVLAAVPGTDEANEAIVLASIPETAKVSKKELKAPDVAYQGEPQYQLIDGTMVSRAVNTDKDIIKVGDLYYMCFQAVWFVSTTPNGPWEVATSIPKEIYTIPASSASHHVTYVTIEADDDDTDEWVTFAYVAGYTGMMVAYGCVVWGSGWYYPPYIGWGGYYPGYYPYPRTYGMGAWYNPWTGAYGRAAGVYGPYGGVTAAARYNPRTGTYSRGAAAYGPYGGRAAAQAYNPRTGTYASTRQGSNVYGNWGASSVQRGDNWAQTAHRENYRTGQTTSGIRTSEGGGAVTRTDRSGDRTTVGRTQGGDVYAGRDGNVYRRTDGGGWEQSNGSGGWEPSGGTGAQPRDRSTSGTTPQAGQLDRDSGARTSGNTRTADRGGWQSGGSTRSGAGSYGGGGRSRGGGGRRR
jgi:hypothetical protein